MFDGYLQIAIWIAIVVALVKPVGIYMARLFQNERVFLSEAILAPGAFRAL